MPSWRHSANAWPELIETAIRMNKTTMDTHSHVSLDGHFSLSSGHMALSLAFCGTARMFLQWVPHLSTDSGWIICPILQESKIEDPPLSSLTALVLEPLTNNKAPTRSHTGDTVCLSCVTENVAWSLAPIRWHKQRRLHLWPWEEVTDAQIIALTVISSADTHVQRREPAQPTGFLQKCAQPVYMCNCFA